MSSPEGKLVNVGITSPILLVYHSELLASPTLAPLAQFNRLSLRFKDVETENRNLRTNPRGPRPAAVQRSQGCSLRHLSPWLPNLLRLEAVYEGQA